MHKSIAMTQGRVTMSYAMMQLPTVHNSKTHDTGLLARQCTRLLYPPPLLLLRAYKALNRRRAALVCCCREVQYQRCCEKSLRPRRLDPLPLDPFPLMSYVVWRSRASFRVGVM